MKMFTIRWFKYSTRLVGFPSIRDERVEHNFQLQNRLSITTAEVDKVVELVFHRFWESWEIDFFNKGILG